MERIKKVREYRLKSKREVTVKLAQYPYLFGEVRQPDIDYIVIPRHSSELRQYIPMDIRSKEEIISDSCCFISVGSLYHFRILSSSMHMAWVRRVCGGIKSDFRYSNKLVYNNFPWPKYATIDSIAKVEKIVFELFEVRKEFNGESLANLSDPVLMPQKLRYIHKKLDLAVESCYRKQGFYSKMERIDYLFRLYKYYIDYKVLHMGK